MRAIHLLLVILVVLIIASLLFGGSLSVGYAPGGIFGAILLVLIVLILMGRL
jgi:hypothetical protein